MSINPVNCWKSLLKMVDHNIIRNDKCDGLKIINMSQSATKCLNFIKYIKQDKGSTNIGKNK